MTACRWASPRVAEVALASAAVIRAFPAARCVLSVEHANDSGTGDVVDVPLVVEGDVLELVEDDEEEDDDEDEEELDEDELLDDELELLDDDDDDEEEEEDDDELEEDDEEVVPAAKLIERWAKKPNGVGCSTRRVQSLLVVQFSTTLSSDVNVLVTLTVALEKLPPAPTGTPAGVRALQRSTPLSTRHSLMK